MPIHLIASVVYHKHKFIIGKENDLVAHLKEDLKYFKTITSNRIDDSPNIVLMGRKTWFSLPTKSKPLKNRVNIVLTNDYSLINLNAGIKTILKLKKLEETVYFMNLSMFLQLYKRSCKQLNVFVIGGSDIYNIFLNENTPHLLKPETLYITEVKDYFKYNTFDEMSKYNYINEIPDTYQICSVSSKMHYEKDSRITFRFLKYRLNNTLNETNERDCINMMKNIMNNGNKRIDRTGTGTVSIFGTQMRFDISKSIPLLTTRFIPLKVIIEELMWFLRGDTDANILKEKGINIWNGNTSREFLDSRGLYYYNEGVLGPGYGFQMRFFGAKYSQEFSDTSMIDTKKVGGFDQLKYVLNTLNKDPYSRRIMMSYWNPPDFDKTALIPCFPSDTLVLTQNGYKKIQNVLPDDKLYTHNRNWEKIVKTYKKQYNDKMYYFNIKNNGEIIQCTKEHPFYVKELVNNKLSKMPYWCNAEDIDKNKHVLCFPINKEKKLPSSLLDKLPSGWFILGYFINNAWCKTNEFNFLIDKKQSFVIDIITSIINVQEIYNNNHYTFYSCKDKNWINLLSEFGDFSDKKIPYWVQDAPKYYIEYFLKGFVLGRSKKYYSANIAYSLQSLNAKIGKMLSLKRNKNNFYTLKQVDFDDTVLDDDFIYFPIKHIHSRIKKCTVYNFEVDNDNTYTVQNISVHNCHTNVQFYVEDNPVKGGKLLLSCLFYMRSNDFALANNFNVVSYSVLTYILALKCDMLPKEIIYTCGDTHIYKNHIEPIKSQLNRNPRPFPVLLLNEKIKTKDFKDIVYEDFELCGYYPHSSIKLPMAV